MDRSNGVDLPPFGGAPTIRAVAAHAGVSKSLVSLVMRGAPNVSPERRRAVLEAAATLGYRPNAAARTLAQNRSDLVGVVLNNPRNPWYLEVLDGMGEVLEIAGIRTLLGDGNVRLARDIRMALLFGELRVDGLVLIGPLPISPELSSTTASIPSVVVGSREERSPGSDLVTSDDELGAALATQHLLDLGHQHLAHIAGVGVAGALRHKTFTRTVRQAGLEASVVEHCDMTEDGGYRAAVRLLSRRQRPTAIFVCNDLAAIGALSAAQELGLQVPGDVSLVGYDNTYVAGLRHIGLTTVNPGGVEAGRRVARRLLARIEDPGLEPIVDLMPPTLELRSTTGPPPSKP